MCGVCSVDSPYLKHLFENLPVLMVSFDENRRVEHILGRCENLNVKEVIKIGDKVTYCQRILPVGKALLEYCFNHQASQESFSRRKGFLFETKYHYQEISGKKVVHCTITGLSKAVTDTLTEQIFSSQIKESSRLIDLGRLMAGFSHEPLNPLMVAMGSIEMVSMSQDLDEKIVKRIKKAESALEHMAEVIHNTSHLSKLQAAPQEWTALHTILKDAMAFSKMRVSKDVTVQTTAPDDIFLQCNKTQFTQVFMNLIINASDAISQLKEKWIRIECISPLSEEAILTIKVIDSGGGIPEEHAAKIFQPFFTTKTRDAGTGIGLSIIHDILREHNFSIHLDQTDKNTCFVIRGAWRRFIDSAA